MKRPLKREWNTTFDVMITGLMFSSNRAHHLVIFIYSYKLFIHIYLIHIYSRDFFFNIYFVLFFRRERASCEIFSSLSLRTEIYK